MTRSKLTTTRIYRCTVLVCLAVFVIGTAGSGGLHGQEIDLTDTQIQYNSGQHVAPIYEGWMRNADGTIDFWFGYLNRNWEEVLHIPVGPANHIEPGGPDRGQPTVFIPRRRVGRAVQRRETFVFRVRAPSNWTSDDEIVWTVSAHEKTDRAVALFLPIYELRPRDKNIPPTLEVGVDTATVVLGGAATLTVSVSDDGEPQGRRGPANLRWVHYRGSGSVTFQPARTPFPKGDDPFDGLEVTTTATFSQPGTFVLRAVAYDGDVYGTENVTVHVTEGSAGARQ